MIKALFVFLVIIVVLLFVFFAYNYFNFPKQKETSNNTQNPVRTGLNIPTSSFKGPTGPPSIQGPSGPPPGSSY